MEKTIKWVLIVIAFALIAILIHMKVNAEQAQVITTPKPVDILSERQRVWINALRWCESNAVDGAINPKDKDGTASLGRYQFKTGTFAYYQKLYGLPSAELMDGEAQERIVEQMIVRGGIKWSNEFPECTRKLGTPPQVKISTTERIDNK